MAVTNASGSALAWARMKSLPPVSPTSLGYDLYFAMFSPTVRHIAWNTSVEPVK